MVVAPFGLCGRYFTQRTVTTKHHSIISSCEERQLNTDPISRQGGTCALMYILNDARVVELDFFFVCWIVLGVREYLTTISFECKETSCCHIAFINFSIIV